MPESLDFHGFRLWYRVNMEDITVPDAAESIKWYVLGMRNQQALRVAAGMAACGFECFVPPKITNLLFVHALRTEIDSYLTYNKLGLHLYYVRSKTDSQPIVVRDKDMTNFMLICKESDVPIIMTEPPTMKLGDSVRVTDGPLRGVEGRIVRIRKQKRILVNVGEHIWAATAYVKPEYLEILK